MNIAFRADASVQIGSGHVLRCLTLAESLCENGASVFFVSRDHSGNLCDFISEKGIKVFRLPAGRVAPPSKGRMLTHASWLGASLDEDADQTLQILKKQGAVDWLIVDCYALDERWERQMRRFARNVMVIDDIADRPHDCNLLLDQNLYDDMEHRYDALVPAGCRKLLGPRYALLRREFIEARRALRQRDGVVRRILVFFGGADATNETEKALRAFRLLERHDIRVDVVVGKANPHRERIETVCREQKNVRFFCNVDNMAQLMTAADLSLGGGRRHHMGKMLPGASYDCPCSCRKSGGRHGRCCQCRRRMECRMARGGRCFAFGRDHWEGNKKSRSA